MQSSDEEVLETSSSPANPINSSLEIEENKDEIQETDDIKSELKKIHKSLKNIEDGVSQIKRESRKESLNAFSFATMAIGIALVFHAPNIIALVYQILFLAVGLILISVSLVAMLYSASNRKTS